MTSSSIIALQDVIGSCKWLKVLSYMQNLYAEQLDSLASNYNLEQLDICSLHISLPNSFMNAASAHGGLVHVLYVRSVTSEDATVLLRNSLKLMTLQVVLNNGIYDGNGTKLNPMKGN